MSYISKQEIEDAVKALNRAAVRVRETSSALHNAEDKIKQDEQSLQSAHESKNSARAQVHYARSDTNADERIRNLQSQLESSRVQHEEAAKADAEARKTLDAARATAEKLLSKLDDALSRVTGNIQKLRGARGKSAEYLHANLNAEQQEESKLRQLRERLAEALGSSRDAEQKTSSGGMRGGGAVSRAFFQIMALQCLAVQESDRSPMLLSRSIIVGRAIRLTSSLLRIPTAVGTRTIDCRPKSPSPGCEIILSNRIIYRLLAGCDTFCNGRELNNGGFLSGMRSCNFPVC